ncbi:hypothetical protein, partial [Kribbella sp. NPDC048915]|uniref:hypothetical protein n=1 Tax=Kribbella sp. NPDC048915 TaxID=3155148 RepID=UPI0033DF9428
LSDSATSPTTSHDHSWRPADSDPDYTLDREEPGYEWVCLGYHCQWTVRDTIITTTVTTSNGTPEKDESSTRTECTFKGAVQPCIDAQLGNWSNSHQCYMKREEPPPRDDPRWQGHADGSIWACQREQGYDQGRHIVTEWIWLPGEPDTIVVDPMTLVYRAVAAMQLEAPLIETAPAAGQIGLVNMPVWMWVNKTENTWGPIERTASVPGLSVTASARVTAVDWAVGDGKVVRCKGPGTPYTEAMGTKASPTCGHRYVKTSAKLPGCKYPVTATARWSITWRSTLGDTGQISMDRQATTQLRIAEAVPVLVDPEGGETSVAGPAC